MNPLSRSTLVAALLTLLAVPPALAANEGCAVAVDPDASVRAGQAERVLVVGEDVSVGERIVTGATGKVQLIFADQTRLVVGPRSDLLIETYLMAGSQADSFVVNALAGSFRFMTGNGAKSAYAIKTPSAAIAVRGTSFDLAVADDESQLLLFQGAVQMCQGTTCIELTGRCDIGAFGAGGSETLGWDDAGRGERLRHFLLAGAQSRLDPGFRISGANACLYPPADEAPLDSGVTESSSGDLSQFFEPHGVPGPQGPQNPQNPHRPTGGQ